MKKFNGVLIVFLVSALLLSACGSEEVSPNQDNGTSLEENVVEITATPEGSDPGEVEPGQEGDDPGSEPPGNESGETATLTPNEHLANDACLAGSWLADNEAFAEYLSEKMNVSDQAQFLFYPLDGEWRLIFDGIDVAMSTEVPLTTKLELSIAGTFLMDMVVEVSASGTGKWGTNENKLVMYGQELYSDGKADAFSSLIDHDFSSSENISLEFYLGDFTLSSESMDVSFLEDALPPGEPYGTASYVCTENTLTLSVDESETEMYFIRE